MNFLQASKIEPIKSDFTVQTKCYKSKSTRTALLQTINFKRLNCYNQSYETKAFFFF